MALIEKFLYSVIDEDDYKTLFKLKDKFLLPKEQKYISFVQDFYALYSKLPEISTVEDKFNIELIRNTESANYWYNEIYNAYRESLIEEAIITSAKNKKSAIGIFQQAIMDYNSDSDVQVHNYTDGANRLKSYKDRKGTNGISYLSTGMPELDVMSLGYKKADLWTIGGAEGMGKTWFLLKMANALDTWTLNNNIDRKILIVSGEMTAEELEERLDAIRCHISYSRLSSGNLTTVEERKYERYLNGFESNIILVDSFDNINDVEYLISLYRPCCIFIDGSHLLSSSYEWKDISQVTKKMKTLTRNNKVPIINTTHLKAEKGNSASGGSLDDFAYTKGYTRDSDIVGVMYASDIMVLDNQIGIDWVKVRRGDKYRAVWQSDYDTCTTKLVENLTGRDLASAKLGDDVVTSTGNYTPRQTQIY